MAAGWRWFCADGAARGVGWADALAAVGTGLGPCLAGGVLVGAAGLAAARALRCRAGRYLARCVAWCAAGCLAACGAVPLQLAGQVCAADELGRAPVSAGVLEVTGDPSVSSFGVSADATLWRNGARVADVRLSLPEAYQRGTCLTAVGSVEALEEGDWDRALFMRGVVAEVRVAAVTAEQDPAAPLYALRAAVLASLDPEASQERALVAGTVCGYSAALNAMPASDAFALTGLSHLVAVSGSHLTLVAALVTGMLERAGAPRPARTALIGALMGLYVVFTGGAPSAVRSLVMVMASMGSSLGGRRPHALSGLGLTVWVLLVARPGLVYDLGFQLSVASVLSILLLSRYLACLLCRVGVPRTLAELLALTLSAQWATLPLTMSAFGQVSLIAPLANLVAEPPMTALLASGIVVAPFATAVPALGFLWAVPLACARVAVFAADLLAGVPYAALAVEAPGWTYPVLWGSAAAVFWLWASPRRAHLLAAGGVLAALAGLWIYVARFCAAPCVTVLDVGQADAILIRDGGQAVLVDAGEDEATLAALARNGVLALDAVVVTHWHSDHVGGLDEVAQMIPVGAVYAAAGAAGNAPDNVREAVADTAAGTLGELQAGDTFPVGRFVCTVLWPLEEVAGNENGDSLCLEVSYRDGADALSALLTGDAERDQLGRIADEVGDIDALKLGHHGSAESVDDELLDALRPEVAVASAGAGNRYGHPTSACREAVERSGATFLCTIDSGDVRLAPAAEGVAVTAR